MGGAAQSGPSALFPLLAGGLFILFVVLAFLLHRTGQSVPAHQRYFRWGSRITLVLGAILFLLFALELTTRILIPGGYLRSQPHRGSEEGAIVETLEDGRAYWEYREDNGFDENGLRDAPAVADPVFRLGVAGDSVTYGVGIPAEKRFVHLLVEGLQQRCGPIQLFDSAVPGYALHQERIGVQRKVLPLKPDVLFVGVYSNDSAQFTVIGDTAYDIRVDLEDGFPVFSFLPLPDALNALLVQHSVFYQWVTLRGIAAADKVSGRGAERQNMAVSELEVIRSECDASGTRLVIALFPDLADPLSEPESKPTAHFYGEIRAWATTHNVSTIEVRELLAKEDVEAIRLDECCHYNEAGHVVVAASLEAEMDRLGLLPALCR